jgi:hypothetical protein
VAATVVCFFPDELATAFFEPEAPAFDAVEPDDFGFAAATTTGGFSTYGRTSACSAPCSPAYDDSDGVSEAPARDEPVPVPVRDGPV